MVADLVLEPGLADAGLPADDDDLTASLAEVLHARPECVQLAVPADDR
jgi:hypothetical protein